MINAHGPQPSEPVEEMPIPTDTCTKDKQWEGRQKINILKNWEIRIQFYDIGCVVHVGCKNFAFESVPAAMQVVNQYTDDPAAVAKAYGFEGHL